MANAVPTVLHSIWTHKMADGGIHKEAESIYADIASSLNLVPDYDALYVRLNRLFQRLLNEHTQFANARLVGSFAKLDYLLKEGGADASLHRHANDMRVHLHDAVRGKLNVDDLQRLWQYDARALCDLSAFVCKEEVPQELQTKLPTIVNCQFFAKQSGKAERSIVHSSAKAEALRLIVERWDEQFVYGRLSTDGVQEVKVNYTTNSHYPYDWTYLRELWHEGSQLNLVRPTECDGVLYPELIIYEPDYLVDASQIAHCFAPYAESPLVSLIDRLSPSETSEAILLGFLASQLLDEELHNLHRPYAESAMDFFRTNAMDLLATELKSDFHVRAQMQRTNIHNAVDVQLPMLAEKYRKEDVVVEPSFVSEMLGLQGRMDFLQTDMRVLIEQKSGKAAFVPHDPEPDNPKPREEHYVQMLLYMAVLRYNHRAIYEQNNRQLHAFLMYSAYPNALVGLSFAPELLFRALKLRNRLVAQDMRLAQEGFRSLVELTADDLNEKGIQGRLWDEYIRPRLEQTLRPIPAASPLERMYYLRMLRFVAAEHQLSRLGNQTKENSGFASAWHDSLDEKRQAGNIYDGLSLLSPLQGEGYVSEVQLTFPATHDTDTSNFRLGDVVVLYAYEQGKQPDLCRAVLFRGALQDVTAEGLTVALRNTQTDAKVFARYANSLWAVEHDFVESTTTALYRGVHAFLSAPQERRDLLMMQRAPRVDTSRTLRGDYGVFNELQLHVKQARDMFLIIGPPGTGKTSFGMYNTLQEELLEEGASILVMAYTNRAVDEISSKLHGTVDFVRLGSRHSCAADYHEHLLSDRVKECRNRVQLHDLLLNTRVFVGTTTAFSSARSLFQLKRFSLAIVDEASQILEPSLMALMSMQHNGSAAIEKFVLIGDHKQLPAVVQQRTVESEVTEPELRAIGLTNCRLSLFERLLHRYANNPQLCYMLTRQGRMHPEIAHFPNQAFYGGRLDVVPLPHQQTTIDTARVVFYDVLPNGTDLSDKANQAEADVIARLVNDIYRRERERFNATETIGIIVPYRNQIATIRNTIDRLGIPQLHDITIDTVERYQGSQRRYIIYGFTIRYAYQLRFLTDTTFVECDAIIDRKLNVAMTRAQEQLMLVGNARLLSTNEVFGKLLRHLNS